MSGFLLDTNCISELVRPHPEPRVIEWFEAADEEALYLSVLTLGEIRKGVAGLIQGRRRTRLEMWLEIDLRARFAGRILPSIPPSQIVGDGSPPRPGATEPRYPSLTDCSQPPHSTTA